MARIQSIFFVIFCLVGVGCGAETQVSGTAALMQAPVAATPVAAPAFIQALEALPGCYTPVPATAGYPGNTGIVDNSGSTGLTSTGSTSLSGDANSVLQASAMQMQEMNLSYNVQFFVDLSHAILASPLAGSWTVTNQQVPSSSVTATLQSATSTSSSFAVRFTWRVNTNPNPFGTPIWETHTDDATLYSSTAGTEVKARSYHFRWTGNSWELQTHSFHPVGTQDGLAVGFADGIDLASRGCDPASLISFATFGGELLCWTATGSFVSCQGVDLWP